MLLHTSLSITVNTGLLTKGILNNLSLAFTNLLMFDYIKTKLPVVGMKNFIFFLQKVNLFDKMLI